MPKYYEYNLLIESYSKEILKCINRSQYTIIKGPTGCGKSTYIPLLLNDGDSKIAIIEPRRIAVTSLYTTLSGASKDVGYKMRFNKKISGNEKIIIYTDGAFLNDGINKDFDYIIVDEVHERSVRIDVILCLLKETKAKVILMSATVDTSKIQKYFNSSVFEIQGQSYPVDIIYTEQPVSDYILESYNIIKNIVQMKSTVETNKSTKKIKKLTNDLDWLDKNSTSKSKISSTNFINIFDDQKDILVFLTGEEDINDLEKLLKKILGIKIYKIYSNLNDTDQMSIYEKSDVRKIILSTNICETSLTIPGIKYVIDSGLVKNKIYDGINYFGIVPISKESSDQRLGRCNRTGPGICYRLYTKEIYDNLDNLVPEIMIADLSKPILQLIDRNINIFKFIFLDYPTQINVKRSISFLRNKNLIDDEFKITKLGQRVLRHPFEINLSCFYEDCIDNGLGYYGSMLVSLISIDNYNFIKNVDMQYDNKESNKNTTDIKYLVKMFTDFVDSKDKKEFCKNKEISLKNLDKAFRIFKCLNKNKKGDIELLEKIFSKSFSYNLSVKEKDGSYRHIESDSKVFIHPSSNFFKKSEKKIVFVDVLYTTREYVRIVGKHYK
ncbi:hypothetical protein P3W45_000042 [Vairimorpha bombi]